MHVLLLITIISRLFAFQAPGKTYDIRSYGARPDGVTDNTAVLQKVINLAASNGGGVVLVPSGRFLTGVLHLQSGVRLSLAEGAVLLGSARRIDYGLPQASALIVAKHARQVSITGKGTIDGQARLLVADVFRMLKEGTLQDPEWKVKRPTERNRPMLLDFDSCEGVTLSGITLRDASGWVQRYGRCTGVSLDSVTVESTAYWNNDGVDIVDCRDVRITNCRINASDDGICLKSEDVHGRCENVYVANCTVRSSASAFKLGTGSSGGFRGIVVRGLTVYDTYRSAIALESVDGGVLEDVDIRGVRARNTGNALFIRLGHRNKDATIGALRRVYIGDVEVEVPAGKPDKGYDIEGPPAKMPHNIFPASIVGFPGHPVQDVTLEDIRIHYAGTSDTTLAYMPVDSLGRVPEVEAGYPEFSMFGELPAAGLFVRHVSGLRLNRVRMDWTDKDYRPAYVFDDVSALAVSQ